MRIFFLSIFLLLFSSTPAFSVDKEIVLRKIENLSFEEKRDLTNFFRICFHSYALGYVIFGEKPMNADALKLERPPFEDIKYKDVEWCVCSYRKKEGWEVWKNHFQDIPLNGFSFIFHPVPGYPGLLHFSMINHKRFLDMVEQHIEEFHKVLNRKISAMEILNEFTKAKGEVFELIINHDGLLGILLGYGKENAFKYMNGEKLSSSIDLASIKPGDMSEVQLPSFKVAEGSDETKKIMNAFRKQKKKINEFYQKENFLEIVLLKLFCKD